MQLQKTFTTLENLANANVQQIIDCIKISEKDASEVIIQAKELHKIRTQKKELQKMSLGAAGTTKEKAARATYISNLADLALEAAEKPSNANSKYSD